MAIEDLSKWLAPWEKDKDGKKLDTPAEINPDQLKKYLHGLLSDKEKAQTERDDVTAELANVKDTLATVQREHETADQTKAREAKEQADRIEKLEKAAAGQQKLDVALSIPGITPERARVLAKRISGDDEKALRKDAEELVAEGFRVSDEKPQTQTKDPVDGGDDGDDIDALLSRPVVRSNGSAAKGVRNKDAKSDAQLIDELIPVSGF